MSCWFLFGTVEEAAADEEDEDEEVEGFSCGKGK